MIPDTSFIDQFEIDFWFALDQSKRSVTFCIILLLLLYNLLFLSIKSEFVVKDEAVA